MVVPKVAAHKYNSKRAQFQDHHNSEGPAGKMKLYDLSIVKSTHLIINFHAKKKTKGEKVNLLVSPENDNLLTKSMLINEKLSSLLEPLDTNNMVSLQL